MTRLAEHVGEWKSLEYLRENGRVVKEQELKHPRRIDLQESKPVIIGHTIWVVFLYDRFQQRYFLEEMYTTNDPKELLNAFTVVNEEWI